MLAKVQKWGNSLALRIPAMFAKDARLTTGSEVDLSILDGKLIIEPTSEPSYSLTTLLKGVTNRNRHSEIDTEDAVGQEAW